MSPHPQKRSLLPLCILFLFAALYYTWFIFSSSFLIDGRRYFCLFDDAMVSMTYAKNLTQGYGLVWFQGMPPVEGFSNPLWVFIMALFHLLPIEASHQSLCIQLLGAILLMTTTVYARRIFLSLRPNASLLAEIALCAVILFNYSLLYWSLAGMEVSLAAALVVVSISLIYQEREAHKATLTPYLLLGLGTFLRMDLIVIFIGCLIAHALSDRTLMKRILTIGVTTLVLSVIIQSGLRFSYYGEWLPNTYYLKMQGYPILLRITAGFYTFIDWIFGNGLLLFIAFIPAVLKKNYKTLLLYVPIVFVFTYSIYVGGDAWERWIFTNRFISVVWPLLSICFLLGILEIVQLLKENSLFAIDGLNIRHTLIKLVFFFTLLPLLLLKFSFPNQDLRTALSRFLLYPPPAGYVEDNRNNIKAARAIMQTTKENASILLSFAGTPSYFLDHRILIDALGKNDSHIAHGKGKVTGNWSKFISYRAGHVKSDYDYSIRERKPDLIMHMNINYEEAYAAMGENYIKFITADGIPLWKRKDSTHNDRF